MLRLARAALAASLLVVLPSLAWPDSATVKRPVNLRPGPTRANEPIRLLQPPTRLDVLDPEPTRGYFRVRTASGQEGFVWGRNVRVQIGTETMLSEPEVLTRSARTRARATRAARAKAKATKRKPKPCAVSIDACPTRGCAKAGTAHALSNQAKRNDSPTGPAVRLSFDQFARLQEVTDDELNIAQGRDLEDRDPLKSVDVDGVTVGEGRLAEMIGFISPERNIKASGGESVNCRFTKATENDIHLPIVEADDDSEYDSVVIEPIPQHPDRKSGAWSVAKFKQLQEAGRKLLIRGSLFYDNTHKVRSDPEEEEGLKGEPKRFTLWEIHPVTEILVCRLESGNCNPDTPSHWTALGEEP